MSAAPTPPPAPTRWQKARPWLLRAGYALLPVLSALLVQQGCPREVVNTIEVLVPAPAAEAEYAPVGGWVEDPDAIAENLDPDRTEQFDRTPAGRAVMGDDDVFLWRAVRRAGGFAGAAYPNVNQGPVGCCVGCGWKHCADAVQATAIAAGARFEWKPVSAEVIYAGSRVEVGGGRIGGDGSVGAWAAKWSKDRGGLVAEEKVGPFSPARARQWGRTGVPDALEPDARLHPVKGVALVKSWADAKRAIAQGYPVAVCSNQGFTMTRDQTGRCRPQGVWNHCMALIAVRAAADGRPEGGFLLNSWGDNAHTGPRWPADAPAAGFWADAAVLDRMLRQGDSFALADVVGFPARPKPPLTWDVRGPATPVNPARESRFALAW